MNTMSRQNSAARLSEDIGDVLSSIRRLIAEDEALTATRQAAPATPLAEPAARSGGMQGVDGESLARRFGGNAALARHLAMGGGRDPRPAAADQRTGGDKGGRVGDWDGIRDGIGGAGAPGAGHQPGPASRFAAPAQPRPAFGPAGAPLTASRDFPLRRAAGDPNRPDAISPATPVPSPATPIGSDTGPTAPILRLQASDRVIPSVSTGQAPTPAIRPDSGIPFRPWRPAADLALAAGLIGGNDRPVFDLAERTEADGADRADGGPAEARLSTAAGAMDPYPTLALRLARALRGKTAQADPVGTAAAVPQVPAADPEPVSWAARPTLAAAGPGTGGPGPSLARIVAAAARAEADACPAAAERAEPAGLATSAIPAPPGAAAVLAGAIAAAPAGPGREAHDRIPQSRQPSPETTGGQPAPMQFAGPVGLAVAEAGVGAGVGGGDGAGVGAVAGAGASERAAPVDDTLQDPAMRGLIREIIGEELHGELGTRFARNLRAVIRREVAAAIEDQMDRF